MTTRLLVHSVVRDLAEAAVAAAATAEEEDAAAGIPKWQPIFTLVVLIVMFGVLILDKVGTDSVMLTALMCFYVSGIIDIKETLTGFNSQGLLTVLVLFVVAEGLNKTGALNWYVGKLFGRPTTLTGAQLRIMIPITVLSGFINDTPLVTIALPIVVQWAKKINLSTRFLLMPLSFAALLGGVSKTFQQMYMIFSFSCNPHSNFFRFIHLFSYKFLLTQNLLHHQCDVTAINQTYTRVDLYHHWNIDQSHRCRFTSSALSGQARASEHEYLCYYSVWRPGGACRCGLRHTHDSCTSYAE